MTAGLSLSRLAVLLRADLWAFEGHTSGSALFLSISGLTQNSWKVPKTFHLVKFYLAPVSFVFILYCCFLCWPVSFANCSMEQVSSNYFDSSFQFNTKARIRTRDLPTGCLLIPSLWLTRGIQTWITGYWICHRATLQTFTIHHLSLWWGRQGCWEVYD